ncbi:unnamed protein product [Linum tenue]|uniref:Cytochrome P450 n=1 Tax=Linum tenue TaxID=586396 RepID=A0AAV0QUW2_9ROSI|nr:unnamed protein product [Linum tenue]
MADKYGAVLTVWLGMQRVLVVSDPKVVNGERSKGGEGMLHHPRQGSLLPTKNKHRQVPPLRQRRVRGLTVRSLLANHSKARGDSSRLPDGLRATEHVRQSEVDSLVSHLCSVIRKGNDDDDDQAGTVVAMNAVFESLTLNVTTRIMAGRKSHVFDDDNSSDQEDINEEAETKRIGRLIKEFMKLAGLPVISDVIPLLSWTRGLAGSVKAMRRVAADFEPILSNWISQHEAVSLLLLLIIAIRMSSTFCYPLSKGITTMRCLAIFPARKPSMAPLW